MTQNTPHPHGVPQPRSAAVYLVLLPLAALPLWAWTLWTAPESLFFPLLTAGGITLASLVVLVLVLDHHVRRARALRVKIDALLTQAGDLAERGLPGMVHRLRSGESAERVLHALPKVEDPAGRAVLHTFATAIADAEQRRAATVTACATAAGRLQALTTTMLADLRQMQERHGDSDAAADVLGDLMHLDHSTAQAGRTADSIAVLTGARSGRRWGRAIPLESIVRGAMSRIGDYRRVRVHHVPERAVAGFAAEGVIHALAELLDNAAKFSPPTAQVHVHVEEVQAGVTIMIEDGGLIMGEEALAKARSAVTEGEDLGAISGTRLGLSVVGRIARRYGLSVAFRASSLGGTAVVLLLPEKLVKPLPAPSVPAPAPAGAPTEESTPVERPKTSPIPDSTPPRDPGTGLPVRRRGRTLAAVERKRPAPTTTSGPTTSAKGFGAFRDAVRGQDPTGSSKDT